MMLLRKYLGWRKMFPALILATHAGLLGWSALRQTPTIDEPSHLVGGLRHWEDSQFDLNRGNPPLSGDLAALPVYMVGARLAWTHPQRTADLGESFLARNGSYSFWLITFGRWALIPLSVLGGYVCYRWACDLYGYAGGLTAVSLWSFCPNVLGNGSLMTADIAATSLGIASFFALWKWDQKPSYLRALTAGLVVGFTELTKFVWVLMYLLWPALWLTLRLTGRSGRPPRACLAETPQVLVIMFTALFVVNAAYEFTSIGEPLGKYRIGRKLVSLLSLRTISEPSEGPGPPNSSHWLERFPVPFPEAYIGGIDEIASIVAYQPKSYLGGEIRRGGWWYYYPYALMVKLPIGTLILLYLATILAVLHGGYKPQWTNELFLLIPIMAMLCFVTFANATQWLRYILPILPFTYIWAARCAIAFQVKSRLMQGVVIAALGISIVSSIAVFPHSLSYFNVLAGGPLHGDEHLADSNIDWGQDLHYLNRWLEQNPQARPLHLAYFGTTAPRLAGVDFRLPWRNAPNPTNDGKRVGQHAGPAPGWYAVSVNLLRGGEWSVFNGEGSKTPIETGDYSYFLPLEPVARAGYSIRIYYIDCEEANRICRNLGLPERVCQSL